MSITPKDNRFFLDGIGNGSVRVSQSARYIHIRIRNNFDIILVKPIFKKLDDAINFLYTKIDWVKKHRERISKQKPLRLNLSSTKLKRFCDET